VDAIDCLLTRRSTDDLVEPGPDADQLDTILQAATVVPDHGHLRPWRFVVISGDARRRFGDAMAVAVRLADPAAPEKALDKQRRKPLAAPMLVVLVADVRVGHKIPEWEQVASAACTGQNICLAAHALGLGAMWKSSKLGDSAPVRQLLDIGDHEQLLGWVLLGSLSRAPKERKRAVDVGDVAWVLPEGAGRPVPLVGS
jgi:nitroreductase